MNAELEIKQKIIPTTATKLNMRDLATPVSASQSSTMVNDNNQPQTQTAQTIKFEDKVFFDLDKKVIKPEGQATLDRLVAVLATKNKIEINIEGHTDTTNTMDYNQKLSQDRADAVKAYLFEKFKYQDKQIIINAKGYGENKLAVQTKDNVKEQQNRRVEISVKSTPKLTPEELKKVCPNCEDIPRIQIGTAVSQEPITVPDPKNNKYYDMTSEINMGLISRLNEIYKDNYGTNVAQLNGTVKDNKVILTTSDGKISFTATVSDVQNMRNSAIRQLNITKIVDPGPLSRNVTINEVWYKK